MTTIKPHSPPATNNPTTRDAKLPWYRSFIVWLGILLTAALIAGYATLIYVSHTQANLDKGNLRVKDSQQLNQLFGVPFSRDQLTTPTDAHHP